MSHAGGKTETLVYSALWRAKIKSLTDQPPTTIALDILVPEKAFTNLSKVEAQFVTTSRIQVPLKTVVKTCCSMSPVLLAGRHSWAAWGEACPIRSHLPTYKKNQGLVLENVTATTCPLWIFFCFKLTCLHPCWPATDLPTCQGNVCALERIKAPMPKILEKLVIQMLRKPNRDWSYF